MNTKQRQYTSEIIQNTYIQNIVDEMFMLHIGTHVFKILSNHVNMAEI